MFIEDRRIDTHPAFIEYIQVLVLYVPVSVQGLVALLIPLGFLYLASPAPPRMRMRLVPIHLVLTLSGSLIAYSMYTLVPAGSPAAHRLPLFYILPHAPSWCALLVFFCDDSSLMSVVCASSVRRLCVV